MCVAVLALMAAALLAAGAPPAQAARAPQVDASAAILLDARDGRVLYRRAPDRRAAIASATKLMTALVATEELSLDRRLRAGVYTAAPAESQVHLRPGERMSVADLLRALLLESANDAAVTLARGAAGSVRAFVREMNRKAGQLGLRHTRYANPVGLDETGNYSSARDLARLARVVLRNDFLAETVAMPRARLLTGARERVVANRNTLVGRVPWVDGVKTGHTGDAGYVLIGAGNRKGAKLVSVVLGTPSESARDTDTLRLLDYGFGLYRRVRALRTGVAVARPKVAFFGDRRVALKPARGYAVALRRGQRLRRSIDAPGELDGPLEQGTRVGTVSVLLDGRRLRTVPLVTAEAVPRAGAVRKIVHYAWRPLILIALIAVAMLALDRRRRRLHAAEAARRRRRRAAATNR
jgi:serine-type D-Ala-D-Ala carboxypeptidase (penicillin-binding protein 5/6)